MDREFEIERTVDVAALTWPTREIASGEDGESVNRGYVDLRGFSWRKVKESLALEEAFLKRLATEGGTDGDDEITDDESEQLLCLDVGVASVVFALSAAHCVSVTSCRGGEGHAEAHPLVVFRCRQARVPDLLEAAEEAGCGLVNVDGGMLMVYAEDVGQMLGFARAIWARRHALRRLRVRGKKRRNTVPPEQLSFDSVT